MEKRIISSSKMAIPNLIWLAQYSQDKLTVDYDKETDVLYVSFGKPQKADDSIQEEGIIKRTKKGKIVGLTILNASRFKN